jgi:signal transduction histidine kinase
LIFIGVLIPAALALGWLGVRLLEQDRLLVRQREAERQAAAADAITRSLAQYLGEAERQFEKGTPPNGTLAVTRTPAGIEVAPERLVAWIPDGGLLPNAPEAPFRATERLEYRGRSTDALTQYRKLAHAVDPGLKAGALLRSARVLRNDGRLDDALADYNQLARIQNVAFEGTPADLVARRAICDLLQQLGRRAALARTAHELAADFEGSRWKLDRATWELVDTDIERWTKARVTFGRERLALSRALEWFAGAGTRGGDDRFVLPEGDARITVIWHETDGHRTALLIPTDVLESWLRAALEPYGPESISAALMDDRGARVAGDPITARDVVRRGPPDSQLPWTLVLTSVDASVLPAELRTRERLLTSALVTLALFLGGGTYLLWRAVQREVAVAHLQAEFVSAVSHEFRTPLTSLRHAVELLQENDDGPPDRRAAFYDLLARNTERLHRLVESLLDFGRMEHSRKPYDLRPLDVCALTSAVVDEFRVASACGARTVTFAVPSAYDATVRADAPALSHAIWNLLDNAVKYSPGGEPVQVSVAPHPRGVAVAVRDQGIGIHPAEQQEIFGKFVRGNEAIQRGINGTGVGLAIVSHIVDAHHGEIEVESEHGRGSTFRLVLPGGAV